MRGGWVQTTETLRDTIAMRVPALLIGWSISCLGVWAETPQAVAIRNATVVTVSGPVLARATVVLRGGLIEAAAANAAIPADAWIVDGEGLTVYPGLIDAASNWGMPANLVLNLVEHLARPISLALRLFGNLFSGGIMIALLISFIPKFWAFSIIFTPIWKLFDMFIGVIQAFIFALLTILYFQFATEEGGH